MSNGITGSTSSLYSSHVSVRRAGRGSGGGQDERNGQCGHGGQRNPPAPYHSHTSLEGIQDYRSYHSPLSQRYRFASWDMGYTFSEHKKFVTWRHLWVYLAKAQKVVYSVVVL